MHLCYFCCYLWTFNCKLVCALSQAQLLHRCDLQRRKYHKIGPRLFCRLCLFHRLRAHLLLICCEAPLTDLRDDFHWNKVFFLPSPRHLWWLSKIFCQCFCLTDWINFVWRSLPLIQLLCVCCNYFKVEYRNIFKVKFVVCSKISLSNMYTCWNCSNWCKG